MRRLCQRPPTKRKQSDRFTSGKELREVHRDSQVVYRVDAQAAWQPK
jgi:hypothetical protein